ncbi:MAG: hypothetical protein QOD69_436 [Solirubrobacteraceae bacterium]|jgi:hypothetical protein|nr:hypothetical protein [Solirubrobacteraceae bacterium]
MSHPHDLPPDLLETAEALGQHRPSLTEPELAAIKQRASRRPARAAGGVVRSRLAITALLAAGALMSSGGAALGVSALSTDLTASSAQYGPPPEVPPPPSVTPPTPTPTPPPETGGVLGSSTEGGTAPATAGTTAQSGTKGSSGAPSTTAAAQVPRQLSASSSDTLPFTGYAALPLLFVGLALLASGLVLRRRSRSPR